MRNESDRIEIETGHVASRRTGRPAPATGHSLAERAQENDFDEITLRDLRDSFRDDRQAIGLAQHHTMDVFEPIAALFPLPDIATLDELASELFSV